MNDSLFWVMIGLLVLYVGNFLGITMLIYQIPSLKKARHLAWVIPFLRLYCFIYMLVIPEEKKVQFILKYIFFMKQKDVIFAECLVRVLEECPQKSPHQVRQVVRNTPTRFSSVAGNLAFAADS